MICPVMMRRFLIQGFSVALIASPAVVWAEGPGTELFEKKIRPALVQHCYECHSAGAKKIGGKLLLDHRAGWQKGGESGPAIEPGQPEKSLLMAAIRYAGDATEMPPKGK